tara:strand:+ start:257 stop:403 length:147 start_codon:yes stop_codon:yes gene_type:complete
MKDYPLKYPQPLNMKCKFMDPVYKWKESSITISERVHKVNGRVGVNLL